MKVPNILPLLFCIEILGVLLCGGQIVSWSFDQETTHSIGANRNTDAISTPETSNTLSSESAVTRNISPLPKNMVSPRQNPTTAPAPDSTPAPTTTSATSTTSPTSTPTTTMSSAISTFISYKKECVQVLMVAGGLIIACAILLVSTLLLAWKVCQLNRRINMLHSNADLISNSEYWIGTATKDKSKSEKEAKETSVLMADISQTQEEVGNGTAKEEEGKVIEDGQMGEESKKEQALDQEKAGDAANGEEASAGENEKETPVIGDENPSTPKPQEEAADSQSAKAVAASSSEGTEEPKDVA